MSFVISVSCWIVSYPCKVTSARSPYSACFSHLRRLRQIRNYVTQEVMAQLVTSLVISRLDYCNSALAGLPASTLAPQQRVQNAAARLVLNRDRRSHITPALQQLHWLPVKYRIIFKIATLMHHILHDRCPSYLIDLVAFNMANSQRRQLRSSQTRARSPETDTDAIWQTRLLSLWSQYMEQSSSSSPRH